MVVSICLEVFEISIHHQLELLHWQHFDRLACRLGFEDTWLFREGIDTFAGSDGRLFLELHVEDTSKLELAVLLQLRCRQLQVRGHHCLDVLWLQFCGLCNVAEGCALCQSTRSLHDLHGLHGRGHGYSQQSQTR